MNNSTITPKNKERILVIAEHYLSWFHQRDLAEAMTGERKRVKAVEYHLPRLVKSKQLTAVQDSKRLAYKYGRQNGKAKTHLKHDLMCTRCALKFLLQGEGEIVNERFFQESKELFGLVPDWAVLFRRSVLLCEYSTADNFGRKRLMKRKIKQYKNALPIFEDFFEMPAIILFILETSQYEVKRFAGEDEADSSFYFTDLASFMDTSHTQVLDVPIYLWGGDGKNHPLRSC